MKLARLIFALFLFLPAGCLSLPSGGSSAGATGIAGRIVDSKGAPLPGAWVYAYRNPRGGLRGPADFAARAGKEGDYFLDLVEGEYYLVARDRRGSDAGPPRSGDASSIYPQNPVIVRPGVTSAADFRLLAGVQPLLKKGTLASGDTGFSGRLVDAAGKPVAGAFLLAYRDPDLHRMPDAISPAADQDGRFTLFLPDAGPWCLTARTRTRGQPQPGELYGDPGSAGAPCLQAPSGNIRDLGEVVLRPYRR